MRGIRGVTLVVVASLAVAGLAAGAGAQSSVEQPKATDVGITAKEIRIAVVADVESPIVPNLFKASVDAVRGVAKYLNANGGLAGRKVVVDFYDSKLDPTQTRNGEIRACQNDVAMVGTSAAFLTSIDDMRNCKDADGATTGLPDIPFVTTALVQGCSDQSFPIAAPAVVCATKDRHPQTYQANVGLAYYYRKLYGNKLHGVYIFGSDSQSGRDTAFASLGALRDAGIRSDGDFDLSAFATQSQYTQVVQRMKAAHSNYATCASQYTCTVNLRKEATLQGLTGVKVWDCGVQCYDRQFLAAGGVDVEGERVSLAFLPFYDQADLRANRMLADFVKYTGPDKVASYGAYAWAAGIAFRDAVNAAVEAHGINGVTRATIFEGLNGLHHFSVDGMFGPFDLARREVAHCGVTMQVRHGTFVRVRPTEPGTLACSRKHVILRKLDLGTG